ncbi:CAunnamed protein product [Biomphalaria glabrata]|nr:CAunnamed protein product [Biomphalaria glabrata]
MAKEQRLHGSLVSLWTDMLLLALFLHVTVDAAANCSMLKAFAGKQEIDSSLFCTTEFSDTECLPFVESFNVSHLPKKFHTNTLTVERPSAINLVGLVKNYTREKFGPGVRVTWDSPIAEISRHNLEGFLLLLESKHKTSCRLFHFKPNSIELRKMMTFSYDIDRLSDDTFYKLSVFSMPPPSSQDRNDSSRYVDMMLHTFSHYTLGADPALWSPSVTIKTKQDGNLYVKFTLSPPEFNFTHFEILLLKRSFSIANAFIKLNYTGKFFTAAEPEGKVQFDNLESDVYLIKVRVKDPFRKKRGQCLCWRNMANGFLCGFHKCCANSCNFTSTHWFGLKVTEPNRHSSPLQSTTIQNRVWENSTPQTAEVSVLEQITEGLSSWDTIGIIIGTVILVTMIVVGVCLLKKHDSVSAILKSSLCVKTLSSNEKKTIFTLSVQQCASPSLSLRPKKLYMMSGDDHSDHVHMVDSLVQFLELHCHCDVVYPPRAEDIHNFDSPYSWFINHISSSDHIIFVNSVGAQKLIEANLNKTVYRNRVLGPEGDLFTECVKHIFKDNKARDKVINIYFGNNYRESKYITSPFTFPIPRNLPELVLKIHSFSSKDKLIFSSKLPMFRDNIPDLPAGSELLEAIDCARLYEEKNPDWLMEHFGEETLATTSLPASPVSPVSSDCSFSASKTAHRLETMLSADSAFYDLGPRSVSSSELNNYSCSPEHDVKVGHNERIISDKELQLSVFTVPCSNFTNELSRESCHSSRTQTNFSIPANITVTDCSTAPESRCSGIVAADSSKGAFIATIIPPDDISTSSSLNSTDFCHINASRVAPPAGPCVYIQRPVNNRLIYQPDTMSAVTSLTEAFTNINQTNQEFQI